MIDGASPNESGFIVNVDKNGQGEVYKANPMNRTWLSKPLYTTEDEIHFVDVSNIVSAGSKIVNINGEMIRFASVDYSTNIVSGLTRGVNGTGVKNIHEVNTFAYGISPDKKLADAYYNQVWNSKQFTSKGDPLQLSTNPAAKFLELGTF
jgi:hypothetical protein